MALVLYSGSQGPIGTSIWTFKDVEAPAMYLPTLKKSTKKNKSSTNVEVTVSTKYPLLTDVNGVLVVRNSFQMETTFTALQAVISAVERARIFDEHLAFLTSQKTKIINGDATA